MSGINFLNDGDTGLQARTIINALVTEINNGAGTSGTSGSSGASGSAGTSGTSGASGSNGTSGTSGLTGSSGTAGSSGTSGTSGATGSSGTSGTRGTSGSSGSSGSSGIDGTSGTSGSSGMGLNFVGGWLNTDAYGAGDIVQFGTPYVAYVANSNVAIGEDNPAINSKWDLLVQSGTAGTSGTNGLGLTYLGAWSSSTNYNLNDVVRHGTPYKIYIANQAVSSGDTEPDVNAKWTVGVISGNNGQTLSPKGVEASYASMLTNHPTPTLLDTYVLQDTSELWIYDPTSTGANGDGWVNMGEIQGPAGLDGSSGSSGTSGSSGSSGTSVQITQITNVTLTAASWVSANGIYEYTYSNAALLSTSIVDIIPSNSSYSAAVDAEVLPSVETSNGSVKIFATNAPSSNIIITINILN